MDFKFKFFIFVLLVISAVSAATLLLDQKEREYQPGIVVEYDKAVNQAKLVYQESKNRGVDLSSGPCLSNALMPGWVLDIAHNPRQDVDNLSQNQCSNFLDGSAKHFVELDLEGNVVKVK